MFYKNKIIWIIALISGLSVQLNWLSQASLVTEISQFEAISRIVLGPILVWFVMNILDYVINLLVSNVESMNHEVFQEIYPKGYWIFTITILGMFGIRFPATNVIIILFLFCIWVVWCLYKSVEKRYQGLFFSSNEWLVCLFFFSGFSALIYQIVWQRMLFTFFGVNMESVTLIVIVFMSLFSIFYFYKSKLNFDLTSEWTSKWYESFYKDPEKNASLYTEQQIIKYSEMQI